MTPEQMQLWFDIQLRQMQALERIASSLEQLSPKTAPNYQYPLESFKNFDWNSIGVTVIKSDRYGAGVVSWNGHQYLRRSPSNKYDPAVWFSRCTGKDDDGTNKYERLITFKALSKTEVDPLPQKVQDLTEF